MKKPIIVANWKMNLSIGEREDLASEFKKQFGKIEDKDIVICPSAISLMQVASIIGTSFISLGAQDVFWEESGAYTGEISPSILHDLDCRYVIVGHSERRHYLAETNEMINKKVDACLDNNIIPILCIGETRKERHDGQTDNILISQLRGGLKKVDIVGDEQIVIAYEPVWAIGSGSVVESSELDKVLTLIKQSLIDMYPLTIVQNNVRIVYGGSVDADNVANFSKLKLLDGFLIGGASLDIDKFNKLVKKI